MSATRSSARSQTARRAGRGSCSRRARARRSARRGARAAAAPDGGDEHVRVDARAPTYQDTQRFYRNFGEEPIEVLVKGNLQQLVLSSDIERLIGLEGCLSGNVPAAALPRRAGRTGPAGSSRGCKTVKVVFGPGHVHQRGGRTRSTNSSRARRRRPKPRPQQAEARRLRGCARPRAERRRRRRSARRAGEQGHAAAIRGAAGDARAPVRPHLAAEHRRRELRLERSCSTRPSRPARRSSASPTCSRAANAALVSVRMKAGLSEAQRTRTIALIRQRRAMPQWRLTHGESYCVTGEPVIVSDLTSSITHSIELLLIAVLLVMAVTLGADLPRAPAPAAARARAARRRAHVRRAVAVGASLTMASVAVLPVLVGLAVDYAIQFQSRVQEASEALGLRATRRARRASARARAPAPRRSPRPAARAPPRCSCCCSRRCRWCAASACCSWWASRSRCSARSPSGSAALALVRAGRPAPAAPSGCSGAADAVERARSAPPGAGPASC